MFSVTFSVLGQNEISNSEQNKKILFESLSFEEALQKAKKENKLIFVDTYTSWCKPCKEMDKFTFTDSTLSKYFNSNFINIKVDMETELGKQLNIKYQIPVVPTLLFLDGEGKLVSKYVGALAAYELLIYGKALKEGKVFSSESEVNQLLRKDIRQKYLENPCDVDLVITYLGIIPKEEKEEKSLIKKRFIDCIADRKEYSKQQVEFLLERLVDNRTDETYNFYLTNREKFKENYGDSIMSYENYMEEVLFLNDIDLVISNTKKTQSLSKEDIEKFEKAISIYELFSEKLELLSKERNFERPISHSFVIFIINKEAMNFYFENKESAKFGKYLLRYGQIGNFQENIKENFRNEVIINVITVVFTCVDFTKKLL
jgi:thiol-disulfide isomerase/thioredoxin